MTSWLAFRLGDERFAIEAVSVREILDASTPTRVPGAPAFIDGLVNVRGRVVPLADLRVLFGIPVAEPDHDTRIIVVEAMLAGEPLAVAMLADAVEAVTELDAAALQAPPLVGMRWPREFVRAVAQQGDGITIIPDLAAILEAIVRATTASDREEAA